MTKLNVYRILEQTKVEGPGNRFCIWVQGCSRRCEGCWAKSTWTFAPNKLFTVNKLFSMIKAQKNIEGVTFLGGEPFEQAQPLGLLAQKVKQLGLSVVTFTGGTYEQLSSSKDKYIKRLLDNTDLLVDGQFVKEQFDLSRPWIGSENQRYIFLSDRYNESIILQNKNKVEIHVDKTGELFFNGMGDFNKVISCIGLQSSNK